MGDRVADFSVRVDSLEPLLEDEEGHDVAAAAVEAAAEGGQRSSSRLVTREGPRKVNGFKRTLDATPSEWAKRKGGGLSVSAIPHES